MDVSVEEDDSDVIEIIPLEEYDGNTAKLRASLCWLLQKAYKSAIPSDLKDPFYETDNGNWLLKPLLINALSSSELYCQACNNVFPDWLGQWKGHSTIIQVLSRKGIYVSDCDDVAVTETVLSKTAPFHVKAHLALIYALMTAYSSEVISVEHVVKAVRRIASFNASSELPASVEDCATFWLNKVCLASQCRDTTSEQMLQGETNQKVRIVSRTPVREMNNTPQIKNLSEDIGDGSCLAALISHYCPKYLKFSDICIKDNLGIADSLYNLRLVKTFCEKHLPEPIFHFTYEDLLYSTNKMKDNIIVFIAELFYCFELDPAACVHVTSSAATPAPKANKNGAPSLSSATKKSFNAGIPSLDRQHGLKKQPSPTMGSTDSREQILLGNVSIDSDVQESMSDPYLDLSDIDRSLRGSLHSNLHDPNHPDYLEVESVTSNSSRSRMSALPSNPVNQREPLTPARLKTAKEKASIHSKAEERGHGKKKTTSPTKPRKKSPFSSVSPAPEDGLAPPVTDDQLSWKSSDSDGIGRQRDAEAEKMSDDPEVTQSYTIPDQIHTQHSARAAGIPVVDASGEDYRRMTPRDGSVTSSRSSGDFSDHESHKIHYDHKSREAMDSKTESLSVSSGSSSHSKPSPLIITDKLAPSSSIIDVPVKKPATTNFAEIKRLKDAYAKFDNSGLVYMQHGQDRSPTGTPLKSAFMTKQTDSSKKTTFAALPNETTWQQSAQRSANLNRNNSEGTDGVETKNQPLATELMSLKMKLDEKRKEIERKKHRAELQQQKMRQRLGKAAFLQVVSKHMPDSDSTDLPQVPEATHSQRLAADVRERLGQMSTQGQRSFSEKSQVQPAADSQRSFHQIGQSQPVEVQRPTSLMDVGAVHGATRFSGEEIQHTIDSVKKKWFKDDEMSTSSQSLPDNYPHRRDSREETMRALSQSPVPSTHKRYSMEGSDHSSTGHSSDHISYDEYEGSLDRLNTSLTELQGEIARLSLQHEQIKSGRTPTESPSASHTLPKSRPTPAASQKTSFNTLPSSRPQWQVPDPTPRQQYPYTSANLSAAQQGLPDCYSQSDDIFPTSSHIDSGAEDERVACETSIPRNVQETDGVDGAGDNVTPPRSTDEEEENPIVDGFFVSFGESTPKRSKPKLGKGRGKTPAKTESTPSRAAEPTPEALSNNSQAFTSTPAPATAMETVETAPRDATPSVKPASQVESGEGFTVDEVNVHSQREMELKRERLKQLQARRLEEAEKKRIEKEAENAKKREKDRKIGLKQEEAEKRKAEEKKKRDLIFQQYLQKKKEKEEEQNGGPAAPRSAPARVRKTTSRTRPKSMHVSSKDENDSKHSSQDDLSTSGESGASPYRNPTSLRLPSRLSSRSAPRTSKLRKAVSCNTLNQNGQGGATYRRPPSPDLSRLTGRGGENGAGTTAGSEYSGPKLFVKPSQKSNRTLIINAISHCCLAGIVNNDVKNKVLEEIARSSAKHFVILFRDAGLQYRGLYTYEPETEEVFKLIGTGPRYIHNNNLEKYYKYNSGSKSFSEITSTKHLSVSIDAIVPVSTVWKSSKPTTMKR